MTDKMARMKNVTFSFAGLNSTLKVLQAALGGQILISNNKKEKHNKHKIIAVQVVFTYCSNSNKLEARNNPQVHSCHHHHQQISAFSGYLVLHSSSDHPRNTSTSMVRTAWRIFNLSL